MKIVHASACFGFPRGSLESPRFAKGFLPGTAKTSWVSKLFRSHPRCVSFSLFSLPLCCSWGFIQVYKRYCYISFAPVSPFLSLAWVRHLEGEPRAGHGMGLCDGGLGRRWNRARGLDTHLTSLDASGKHSLPLCPFWHHPT